MGEEYAVSLKLLTFWTSQLHVWFAQAGQFNLQKIATDETKYYYVLSALNQGTTTWLLDLINNPPEADKLISTIERWTIRNLWECACRLLHF